MKRVIVIALFILLVTPIAYADRWCQWSGTAGENCLNDRDGVLYVPDKFPARSISIINGYGYYHLTTTQPTIGEDEVRDAEVWDKVDNQISLTWTVRDLTAQEILERDQRAMSLIDYLQWKALIQFTSATNEQVVTFLTASYPEIVDAYLARKAIEEQ